MRVVNAKRKLQGRVEIGYGLGLHIGNVMFGNVGLEDRLAFSALGAAVNEAARLESLTRTLEVPVLASEEFRSRLTSKWLELGPQTVPGIAHPVNVYTPSLREVAGPHRWCDKSGPFPPSDAGEVVLLQRD